MKEKSDEGSKVNKNRQHAILCMHKNVGYAYYFKFHSHFINKF